jgi:hypothetical protein
MESRKVATNIDLLRGVNKRTDNLLVGLVCVSYGSGSAMAVVEINIIVEVHHISNIKYNNSHTINDECRQTIICIDTAM